MKITIAKTVKNYVGGKFVRSESGRSFPTFLKDGKTHFENLCLSSRKDLREAVEAAQHGFADWSGRTAFNRSQVLYRMAEMTEGKRAEFVRLLTEIGLMNEADANAAVDDAIDSFVYYAGYCDKFAQALSTVNPINGPYANLTSPEPVGVVALFTGTKFDFGRLAAQISSIIASGNSIIVFLGKDSQCPGVIAPLAEVFATSDLPGGVVNLLTADVKEVIEVAASHMDIRSLSFQSDDAEMLKKVQTLAVENLKRVIPPRGDCRSLSAIADTVEFKTVWQPMGF